MAFVVYHKIHQVIFDCELLVTDIARSISKNIIFLKIILLFIRSSAKYTQIIVGRVDCLQTPHDKRRNNHKNGYGEVFLKENFSKRILS